MPEMFSLPSASRTSSTLFGRMMVLMSFIGGSLAQLVRDQHALEAALQLQLFRLGEPRALPRHVKDVDRRVPLGRDQDEVHVVSLVRDDAADSIEQTERVVGDDLEHRVLL